MKILDYLNLNPEAFGIDISDLSIRIVKLKKKGRGEPTAGQGLSLASFGQTSIKSGIIKEGRIRNELALVKAIQKAVSNIKGEKLKTRYVTASFPEKNAFLQVIKMPKMEREEMESAIRFEVENYIPMPIHKVYLDFQIIPSGNKKQNYFKVLLAAMPKDIVDPYVSCFKKAGLKIKALEVDSISIVRALLKNKKSLNTVLLIDLGAAKTSFIMFSDNSLRFTASIPISSQKFTEVISRALEVDIKRAEKLKTKYGLKNPETIHLKGKKNKAGFKKEIICQERIFEALIPILTDLVEQTKSYIDYYKSHSKNKEPEKIILCGGGANLKGISKFLSLELKILVQPGNPWINISKEIEMPLEKSLEYTTAIGLALRGITENI
ncbi:type IV pilus assembly protein PilM [Candidatus Parcubacteria bacterium]|nr:type IV pilus assembly protein PilM [Candidatus Parcubacteria bacterium]